MTKQKADSTALRQKAEELLKRQQMKVNPPGTKADMLKLIHELQVHQIELELQNEELLAARIKAELAEEKYANLYDFSPSGLISLSVEGEIQGLNFSAAKMLDKERSRLINAKLLYFISKETRPVFIQFFRRVCSGITSENCEVTLSVNGKPPVMVSMDGVLCQKGTLCLLTMVDITKRKQAELLIELKNKELSQLNAQKDKFFSIIAHDLKSPFSSILGFSQVLLDQVKDNNYQNIEQYATIIGQSSQKALDLLMNLMDWALSQTGKMEFRAEQFELAEVINEIMVLFDEIARQKSISITRVLPTNIPVCADKLMISTVLRNLISNAIKFTYPGGLITISAIRDNQEITISVSDNGLGIAGERISTLFRIDEGFSTPGTSKEKGTGLGLILCKEFVDKHGGRIWVESEEGKGSIFSIALPFRQ